MSYYTVTVRRIYVAGQLWMGGRASTMYDLTPYDIECIGELTRENVQLWLDCHVGDFQNIIDFRADIEDFESDWATEEGRDIWEFCTFGMEDDD